VTLELRVLTYNVRSLRDDVEALARVVRDCDPDLVCVQEAPRLLRWRTRCARLARECGLLYVGGGATTGGAALLASLRVDVADAAEIRLTKRGRLHQRGLAMATVTKSGSSLSVRVASVHLGLDAEERISHAREVLDVLADGQGRTILAGDLNERPGGPARKLLEHGGLRDLGPESGPTFPARVPEKRIDAVLGAVHVEVLDHHVVQTADTALASDHLPVLAVVRVG
jgi:endonuclease/exonuclease/phosphatase family metal-dependent hydrolase